MGYFKKKFKRLKPFFNRYPAPKPSPYEPLERVVANCQPAEEEDRILYFGDSVVERVSRNDVDKTPLGQMVANKLRGRYTADIVSYSAYRPQIYWALSRTLAFAKKKPGLIILPINLRSFSPQWDWNPSFDFEREISAINRYNADPQKKMIRLVPTNQIPVGFWKRRAFLRRKVQYPFSSFQRINQFMDTIANKSKNPSDADFRWRQIFIFHYLYRLEANHRQLIYLQKLLSFLHDLGIPVVSYLTPINYQAGVRYLGDVFKTLVLENVGKIWRQMAGKPLSAISDTIYMGPKLTLANWTFMLTENFFFHRNEPTEHLNESGRNKLSDGIVRLVLGGRDAAGV
jgi:hypothetical protein